MRGRFQYQGGLFLYVLPDAAGVLSLLDFSRALWRTSSRSAAMLAEHGDITGSQFEQAEAAAMEKVAGEYLDIANHTREPVTAGNLARWLCQPKRSKYSRCY